MCELLRVSHGVTLRLRESPVPLDKIKDCGTLVLPHVEDRYINTV